MVLDFHAGDAVLTNIGNGPAVNIEYELTLQDQPPRKLDGYVSSIPSGLRASLQVARIQGWVCDCVIRYESLSKTKYETKLVNNLVLTPPFRFGKASLAQNVPVQS